MNFELYTEKTFLSEHEIVDNNTKIKSLNSLKYKVDLLTSLTEDRRLLSKISSIYLLLEDAYKISMYKFQLKIFIMSLGKEIKNLEDFANNLKQE